MADAAPPETLADAASDDPALADPAMPDPAMPDSGPPGPATPDAAAASPAGVLALTTKIVTAHLSRNAVTAEALPGLIEGVHRALSGAARPPAPAPVPDRPQPAVPVRRSVFPDYLVCLEDGKKLKMLRRHLKTAYNMTPEQYRQKWHLPADYPMVAPNYAQHRSTLARRIGLGTRPRPDPA